MSRLAILLAGTLLLVIGLPLRAEKDEDRRTISTNGQAMVYVVPDEAVVTFGVQTYDADLDKSKAENDKRSAGLLKAVKDLGIEEKHIQIDRLNVELHYKNYREFVLGIEGYTCNREYLVKVKDIKILDKLVDTVLKSGANQFSGIQFESTELRKYRDQARSMAIRAAKEKAMALAKELEMNVGKPRTISESSGYSWGGYRGNGYSNAMQNVAQVAPGGGGDGSQNTPLGQIAITANVAVTFDMQ